MYALLLDTNFDTTSICVDALSIVVTDRYDEHGDFELKVPDTSGNRKLYQLGKYFKFDVTDTVFMIEKQSAEDGILTLTGRELTCILEYVNPKDYTITATGSSAIWCARNIWVICMEPKTSAEYLPNMSLDMNLGTLAPLIDTSWGIIEDPLYNQMLSVLKMGNGGIRCKTSGKEIVYTVYAGNERSIVIREEDGYFSKSKFVRDISDLITSINVKYIVNLGNNNRQNKYMSVNIAKRPSNVYSTPYTNKRTVFVDATSVNQGNYSNTTAFETAVKAHAYTEALKHGYYEGITATLESGAPYTYGVDYKLGDVVTLESKGSTAKAQISEYTWSDDSSGDRNYPTFRAIEL